MRHQQRYARGFVRPAGPSLILLTAICAALLAAEPPEGRHALRHFEGQVVKAKSILHHLSVASPARDPAQIRVLMEVLLAVAPLPAIAASSLTGRASGGACKANPALQCALFQRPPPAPAVV